MGFHWRDGIEFTRSHDGSVLITLPEEVGLKLTIPPDEWVSIINAVSFGGGTAERQATANRFHAGMIDVEIGSAV